MSDFEQSSISGFPTRNAPLVISADKLREQQPARPSGNLWNFNFLSYENRTATALAPVLFAAFVAAQLFGVLALVRYFFPATWDQHLAAGPVAIAATTLVGGVALCFVEYFFHRYVLHIESVRLVQHMCHSHRAHHKLTNIKFDDRTGTVRSAYPITSAEHGDKSTFPPWALAALFLLATPFLAAAAIAAPGIPVLIGGYAAVAIAHFLYEFIHSIHHEPYEAFWKRKIACPTLGSAWTWLYGFHQAHHANYHCNLNVAGFFGVPLGDLLFGTYKTPEPLLLDGAVATKESARRLVPTPRWPVSALDRMVFNRRRRQSRP